MSSARTPSYIIDARVRLVLAWMLAGHRTAAIYRLAARADANERKAHRAAKRAKKRPDEWPALVWTTDATPLSERTIDEYIARAKALLEQEGRTLARPTAADFADKMARLDVVYCRALAAGKYSTCVRVLRQQVELLGMLGVVRWTPPGDDGATPTDPVLLSQTEDEADAELRSLMATAMKRAGIDPNAVKWFPDAGPNRRN